MSNNEEREDQGPSHPIDPVESSNVDNEDMSSAARRQRNATQSRRNYGTLACFLTPLDQYD